VNTIVCLLSLQSTQNYALFNSRLTRISYSQMKNCIKLVWKNQIFAAFAKKETGTLSHIFVLCDIIKPLWKKNRRKHVSSIQNILVKWKIQSVGPRIEQQTEHNCQPCHPKNPILHLCFKSEGKKKRVYQQLKNRLKITESIEESIAFRKNNSKITLKNGTTPQIMSWTSILLCWILFCLLLYIFYVFLATSFLISYHQLSHCLPLK